MGTAWETAPNREESGLTSLFAAAITAAEQWKTLPYQAKGYRAQPGASNLAAFEPMALLRYKPKERK